MAVHNGASTARAWPCASPSSSACRSRKLVGFGGASSASLPEALTFGLVAGVLFGTSMALCFAWLRRRI